MILRTLVVGVLLAVASAPGFGVASAASPPASLRADLAEWSIVPSAGVVRAGWVRIEARNLGQKVHGLEVVRTGRFAATLPLRDDRAVARPVAPAVLIQPGQVRSFVVRLQPGSYRLIDNLPWHYWKGTSVAIAVR